MLQGHAILENPRACVVRKVAYHESGNSTVCGELEEIRKILHDNTKSIYLREQFTANGGRRAQVHAANDDDIGSLWGTQDTAEGNSSLSSQSKQFCRVGTCHVLYYFGIIAHSATP
jgi:hypothetical protein